jgi:phage tail sheath protein FI
MGHPDTGANWGQTAIQVATTGAYNGLAVNNFDLSAGKDTAPTAGNRNTSYDLFNNVDSVDVSLLMAGETADDVVPDRLISIAESRKDCMVFISPPLTAVLNNSGLEASTVKTYRDTITSSSYAVMDCGWKYQYDKYNDIYRWLPLNGDIAGLLVRTDVDRDPWFSPAGLNRGQVKNVVKLAWNPTKAERESLYNSGINPVVTFPGEGTVLFGDKTLLNRPEAMDRINVRRLFIVLEKTVARASRSSLFEFNDEFTRAQFVNLVEPYLREIQGRRGIYDFRVVCDTTNNTPEVIDRNEFVGDIYVKPARSINFIQLNFVAVRTGVAFNEIVGRF